MNANILNTSQSGDWMDFSRLTAAETRWLRLGNLLGLWMYRIRIRQELKGLLTRDARFFKDIGVSRGSVYAEAVKPFWRS